jgi:hypothetical protein
VKKRRKEFTAERTEGNRDSGDAGVGVNEEHIQEWLCYAS